MSPCPCGSGAPLNQCCKPYIEGPQVPLTAEALMRSRYSAYTLHAVDYLVKTTHPGFRTSYLAENVRKTMGSYDWLSLQIVSRSAGGADDTDGTVEFIARYRTHDGKVGIHHERSRFKRHKKTWYYVDGEIGPR